MGDSDEVFMTAFEQAKGIAALVSGYRSHLLELEFSSEASEKMAVDFHAMLMASQMNGARQ